MFHSISVFVLLLSTLPGLIAVSFADNFENVHQKIVVPMRARRHN